MDDKIKWAVQILRDPHHYPITCQLAEDSLKTVLDYILTIESELRRVAAEEAEWWHKRCCERVEVIGQPGVFQCFGCERIAELEHAAKEQGK